MDSAVNSDTIRFNVNFIMERIAAETLAQGRPAGSVKLVAVTKTQAWAACAAAITAGASMIGENRLQEAMAKIPADFTTHHPDTGLHFIGHLQKNKVRKAVALFSCIQSVDDRETLLLIDQEATRLGKRMEVFLEFNTSGESSKSGITTDADLFHLVETGLSCQSLTLRGLMTIGPLGNDETATRAAFAHLRRLSETCATRFAPPAWGGLSMGMTGDYPWAIAEGASLVRIGTALFGPRLPVNGMDLS